jgi:phospholipid/cholesterol/gamma-HCH transport system permease protein
MREWADFTADLDAEGAVTVTLSGPMVVSSVGRLDAALRGLEGPVARLDLSQVGEIDTVGAWTAWRLARDTGAEIVGASTKAERLIAAVHRSRSEAPLEPARLPLLTRVPAAVGDEVSAMGRGTVGILAFLGAMLIASWDLIRRPSSFRGKALVHQLELVGVTALPIIGLMSPAGRDPAARVRRGDLHGQPDGPAVDARAWRADDRDHGRGPLGLVVRRADRDDEAYRGNRRDAHHRRVAG